ncbi:sensor histidine kinase [Bacillus sp. FJAT-42376]|uniref:sensor histidine kinase n=1 Tax=Bacillus sp. FJAT-42376 TaxID=2014076 RepID=UPI000F50ADF2|nr:sensor histidine kinase [Bacillus sp. FJAT-42376]AZB44529.1 sensor histidine kinase [Bacillus sp. FJAT-42376]
MLFSLRNRLFIIFTCLLTIPLIALSFIVPGWFTSIIEKQTEELTVAALDQYSLYANSITSQAQDLGKQVLVNEMSQKWIKMDESVPEEKKLLQKNQVKSSLSSMMINNSNGLSAAAILNDGTGTLGNYQALNELGWYQEYILSDRRFIKKHQDQFQPYQGPVTSYILPFFDLNTFVSYGIIKVNVPVPLLENALQKVKIGKNGHAYLLNKRGENVLSGEIQTPKAVLERSMKEMIKRPDKKGLVQLKNQGEDYLVYYQKLSVDDWIAVTEVTRSDLFSEINGLQRSLLVTSTIVFMITIIASFVLSSNIARPLGKLAGSMRFLEKGDFIGAKKSMPVIKSRNTEVDYLIKVVHHSMDQLKSLIELEYETNIRRKDAEYKALLLQINPHFLNNTLEIIGGLAAQGKTKEVIDVSYYLGRMMRYSLNTQSNTVKLAEEIKYIRSYTDILKLRYEDAISIRLEEDQESKDLMIIKFVLQPLVENAVKYSFQEKTFADIFIQSKVIENQLFLVVQDKGIGMTEEEIHALTGDEAKSDTAHVLSGSGESIGLRNVLGRLKLFYGNRFSFSIQSVKGEGTEIMLVIDIDRGDRDD